MTMLHEIIHVIADPAHIIQEAFYTLVEFFVVGVIYKKVWVKHMHRDVRAGRHVPKEK